MKKRKTLKNYVSAFTFLMTGILLFIFISYLLRPVSQIRLSMAGLRADAAIDYDVIVVGSSSVHTFFSPLEAYEKEGIISYDYAGDAAPASLLINLIKEARKVQEPKLWVIDITSFNRREERDWPVAFTRTYTDSVFYSKNRAQMIRNAKRHDIDIAKDPEYDPVSLSIDLVKYHSRWKQITKTAFSMVDLREENIYKGFTFHSGHEKLLCDDKSWTKERKEVSKSSREILYDLLDYCKEQKLEVCFLISPYQVSNEAEGRYNTYIDMIEAYGFLVCNANQYYEDMDLDFETDFYNDRHVNYLGAKKFTSFFSTYLAEKFNIPDRRCDENTKLFGKYLDLYWRKANQTLEEIYENIAKDS